MRIARVFKWLFVGKGQFTMGIALSALAYLAFKATPYAHRALLEPWFYSRYLDIRLIVAVEDFPVPIASTISDLANDSIRIPLSRYVSDGKSYVPYLPLSLRVANTSGNHVTIDSVLLLNETMRISVDVKARHLGTLYLGTGASAVGPFRVVDLKYAGSTVNLLSSWQDFSLQEGAGGEEGPREEYNPMRLIGKRLEIPPGEHEYVNFLLLPHTVDSGDLYHEVSLRIVGHFGDKPFVLPVTRLWVPTAAWSSNVEAFCDFSVLRLHADTQLADAVLYDGHPARDTLHLSDARHSDANDTNVPSDLEEIIGFIGDSHEWHCRPQAMR